MHDSKLWLETYQTEGTGYDENDTVACALCFQNFKVLHTVTFAFCQPTSDDGNQSIGQTEYPHLGSAELGAICYICAGFNEEQFRWLLRFISRNEKNIALIREVKIDDEKGFREWRESVTDNLEMSRYHLAIEKIRESDYEDIDFRLAIARCFDAIAESGEVVILKTGNIRLPNKESSGYVYLLGSPDGYCKIGRARRVTERLLQIGLQLPYRVELIHSIPVADCISAESVLHRLFKSCRMNGEWFHLTPKQIQWFKTLTRLEMEAICDGKRIYTE